VVELPRRVHLVAALAVVRRGAGDPTWRGEGQEAFWKGWRTPDGPVTLHLAEDRAAGTVRAQAWGPGRAWVLEALPAILGEGDDDTEFVPRHAPVAAARRRFVGWRVPRTTLVLESLVPAIIEQKVTGAEAFGAYRVLVRRFGEPAPGPGPELGLMIAPSAAGWAAIPSWEWLRAGVDSHRSDTVMRAVRRAGRLEGLSALEPAAARERLRAVPGIGVWTAAEVAHVAFGDADAVSFGDYHVARNIGWALMGVETDDAGLAELLTPYAGHRYRVQRLLELTGATRPRRGPRMSVRTHLPGSSAR
jgi:3-methyladenine DNA glycosylase/8-oxoguanine DNA glycosylase